MHRSVSTLENSRLSVYRRVPRSRPFFARVRCALVLMGGVLGLSACASVGTVNDPVGRSLTWYSYLNGDDIRDRCDSEAPDEMRLVFNGRYREQVRQYDLTPWPQPGLLNVLVTQGANLLAGGWTLDDPLGPWRGETFPVRLTAEQNASLWAALERDGAFTPPPRGLALPSTPIGWSAAATTARAFSLPGSREPLPMPPLPFQAPCCPWTFPASPLPRNNPRAW